MLRATYLAGLWSTDIVYQLLWRVGLSTSINSTRRPHQYRAPSWSWAAIESQIVLYTPSSHEDSWELIRVLEWEITPVMADETGQIKSGLIHI